MNYGSVADWLAALAAWVTAVVAIRVGLFTFAQQRTSMDVQVALEIFAKINSYWDRLTDSSSTHYQYDMGQILAHFELAAMLFNRETLSKDALPILKDHIIEVFTSLQTSVDGRRIIELCRSSPDTFKELTAFARDHMPTALRVLQFADSRC